MNKMKIILRQRDFWRLMWWLALTALTAQATLSVHGRHQVFALSMALLAATNLGITLGEGPKR